MKMKLQLKVVSVMICLQLQAITTMQNTGDQPPEGYHNIQNIQEACFFLSDYLPQNLTIVLAGAYDGTEIPGILSVYPNAKIHAFEPIECLFQKLQRSCRGLRNVSTYQIGLADFCGQSPMYLAINKGTLAGINESSSLLPPKECIFYSKQIFRDIELVNLTTLDTWAQRYSQSQIHLISLSTQGMEFRILQSMPKVLRNVLAIRVRVSFIEGYQEEVRYQEIKDWLEHKDFQMIGGDFDFPKDQKQWFGHALFIKKELLK